MKQQQVTVFGAGGFLGRYVIQRLARKGAVVRAVVRDTEAAGHLKTLGDPGQITLKRADVTDPKLVAAAVEGADVVINLVGIIVEKGSNTFEHIHIEGDENVAVAAREAGVKSLVHVSSVVANSESKTQYGRSKAEGDARVLAAFPNAVVLRPAWLIGAEDRFMKMFATMARFSPVLPVIGLVSSEHFCSGRNGVCRCWNFVPWAAPILSRFMWVMWLTPLSKSSTARMHGAKCMNWSGQRFTPSNNCWN